MFSRKKKQEAASASSSTATSQSSSVSVLQTNTGTITERRSFASTSTTSSTRLTSNEVTISGSSALLSANLTPRSIFDNNNSITTGSSLRTDARPFVATSYSSAPPRIIGFNSSSSPSSRLGASSYNSNPTSSITPLGSSRYASGLPAISPPASALSTTTPFTRQTQTTRSFSIPSNNNPVIPSFTSSTHSLPGAGEAHRDPRIPTYETAGKKRAKVLIINNVKFFGNGNDERNGAVKDENDLATMFRRFGFDVKTERNLKSTEMISKLKKFRSDSSLKSYDMSIVVIMSHGNNIDSKGNRIKGGYTEIYGIDNNGIHIDEVLNEFSSDVCKNLNGKPKIFIFQCCRGENEEKIVTDAAPFKSAIKRHADMLLAFSTLPGFSSNRDPKNGTWYIQSITKVFERDAKTYDIEQLLKIVDQELSNLHPTYKQTSTYESRGFKRCYLNPK